MAKFSITMYSIDKEGNTKELFWNEYRSEWLGLAYTKAVAKRFKSDTISHVVHTATGRSTNFVANV